MKQHVLVVGDSSIPSHSSRSYFPFIPLLCPLSTLDRNMPSPAALTIYAFGVTALLAGISSLIDPSSTGSQLNFPLTCTPVARGNALAAIAMGLYYCLAAYQENTMFFAATVPMRLLTTTVFLAQGWTVPAVWEGAGAVATGAALLSKGGLGGKRKGL
ncbi:hypothetical protein GGR51DRAFT_536540 [Nemania sp. FL0031]|nr:hypothetical protein GGR51DRAFT_536540 [Nemania sp. FL0031]